MAQTNTTALVSGAAGATDAAVARSLPAMGARVILLDRVAGPLAELSSSHGDRAVCVVLNLTDDARLPTAVARLVDQFGCVDVRVNNADILTPTKAIATSMEEWRRVMAVNLDAAFILTQEVSAGMRVAKWGQIINMSSYASKSGGVSAGTAHAVAFLASPLARFITKEVIDLNGGLHLD